MRRSHFFSIPLFLIFISPVFLFSQSYKPDTSVEFKTAIAGEQYKASGWHKWLWGSNYRNVWTTPITVKVLWLDTTRGLKPSKAGGGNQTKTLHLSNPDNKEYSVRSVDKTLGKVLPDQLRGTYIENILNDEVSMSNPYAAVTIPYLADKANIYHTNPTYVYLPRQPGLNEYNNDYGNDLYLFEQRVDGNWKEADNLGNFENYLETFPLLDTLDYDNNSSIDQKAFIRARLFDMFINDWDRHEGQWRWGEKNTGDKKIYSPVPVDRDQAYFKHDGILLNLALNGAGLKYMQSFDDDLKNVKTFNYEERNLDRRLTNEATLDDWQAAALKLQQSLTDDVIETAVHNLPKEIYPLIGNDIIEKLKARRNHLFQWATDYYYFISKEVQIPGSYRDEEFNIQQINNEETLIQIFNLDSINQKNNTPFYSRTFKSSETKEIRLFGLAGNDKYVFTGNADNPVAIKIINGINKDSVIDIDGLNKENNNITVYGDMDSIKTGTTAFHICGDTVFRSYRYDWYRFDRKGFLPSIFYTNEDRLYIGLDYRMRHYAWDKQPFAYNQVLSLHYSLMENAFSVTYKALFPNPVKHADLTLLANYDAIRWSYFFGLGNDTKFPDNNIQYYTTRTRQWIFQPGLTKSFGRNTIGFLGSIEGIKILNDTDRYVTKTPENKAGFDWQTFAGAGISYSYQKLNDPVIPVKGFYFNTIVTGEQNLKTGSGHYLKYSGTAHLYIPLVSKFSLNIRAGASTITGNPQFYQYPSIGGTILRGFRRDRFRGNTSLHNTNDLRFISPVHSHFFSGKAGLIAFFDNGRVWMPSENSNTWHTAYGFGVLLAPLNYIYIDATYGRGDRNEHSIQVRLTYSIRR